VKKYLISFLLLGLFLAALIVYVYHRPIKQMPLFHPPAGTPGLSVSVLNPSLKRVPHGKPIVDHGIHNYVELFNAMQDPSIAENFKGFDFSTAHLKILDHSVLAFVSFRVDGKGVFWATTPILIKKGELIWVDDNGSVLRAKCGNRINYSPGFPVNTEEEMIAVFETPSESTPVFYSSNESTGAPTVYSNTCCASGYWVPIHPKPYGPASNPTPSYGIVGGIMLICLMLREYLRY
jgi:hypothetical protein